MGTNRADRHDDRTRRILDEIRRLVRFLRVSARGAQKQLGISGAQLFVLQTLDQTNTPLSVNELAEKTRTHQSSVSVVAKKLVKQKLVRSARARADARRAELTLTASAKALLRRSPNSAQHRLIAALDQMKRQSLSDLVQLLEDLNERLGLDHAVPQLLFEDESADGSSNPRAGKVPRRAANRRGSTP